MCECRISTSKIISTGTGTGTVTGASTVNTK